MQGQAPPALPTRPLAPGSRGVPVETVQAALHAAAYAVGAVDGVFGAHTRDGVYAFEKLHGVEPDGVVSPDEFVEMLRERRPEPPLATPARYVYVDLARQVLLEVRAHRVVTIVHISSGGGYPYTGLDGATHIATTPTGSYRVRRKVRGWDESYLGRLYYPSYYSGGYAIHGAARVPTHPASHGCVRIPIWLARPFFARTPVGTPVFVR